MKKIIIGVSGILILVGVFFAVNTWFGIYGKPKSGQLELINQAADEIKNARIEVCAQPIEIKNLEIGKTATENFIVNCEGHFTISVLFSSGKTLSLEDGYITNGFDYRTKVKVSDTEIKISENTAL